MRLAARYSEAHKGLVVLWDSIWTHLILVDELWDREVLGMAGA